jgi:hypothetical protein
VTKIRIKTGDIEATVQLNESQTARKILECLPIEGRVNLWGEEIYFIIPVKCPPEAPKGVVEIGDIAYWPEGSGFCIFFGKTPVSTEDKIIPASPVNVIGKIIGDARIFKKAKTGTKITISKVQDA